MPRSHHGSLSHSLSRSISYHCQTFKTTLYTEYSRSRALRRRARTAASARHVCVCVCVSVCVCMCVWYLALPGASQRQARGVSQRSWTALFLDLSLVRSLSLTALRLARSLTLSARLGSARRGGRRRLRPPRCVCIAWLSCRRAPAAAAAAAARSRTSGGHVGTRLGRRRLGRRC